MEQFWEFDNKFRFFTIKQYSIQSSKNTFDFKYFIFFATQELRLDRQMQMHLKQPILLLHLLPH